MESEFQFTLSEEFSIEGTWSDDLNAQPKDWLYGRIDHDSDNITTLSFVLDDFVSLKDYDVIYFHTISGHIIKAYNLQQKNMTTHIPGGSEYIYFVQSFVILNYNQITQEGQLKSIPYAKTSFLYLDKWLPEFTIEYLEKLNIVNDDKLVDKVIGKGVFIDKPIEKCLAEFKNDGKQYYIYLERRFSRTSDSGKFGFNCNNPWTRSITFDFRSALRIASDTSLSVKESYKLGEELNCLFEVLLGNYSRLEHLSSNGLNVIAETRNAFRREDIKFRGKKAISFNDVSDNLSEICTKWMASKNNNRFRMLVDNYLSTINNNTNIPNLLLSLTQGIEKNYSGIKQNNKRNKGQLTLKMKLARLINALPDSIPEAVKRATGDTTKEYISKIKDTRVFFTHGDAKENTMTNYTEIIPRVYILRELIRAFILTSIGVPENALNPLIKDIESQNDGKYEEYSSNLFE